MVAISVSQDPTIPAHVIAEGADAFLPKPVQLGDLGDLLIHLLGPLNAPTGE